MEGRRDHRVPLALFLILAVAVTGPARAEEEQQPPDVNRRFTTAVVYTTPDAAVVEAEISGGVGATAKVASNRSGRSCHLEPDTAPVTNANLDLYNTHRDEISYSLYCDGEWVGLVWLPKDPEPRRAPSPSEIRDVVMSLREEIPMPAVTIGVNPAGTGMVGVEAWFWVEGYEGEVITHSNSAFGIPVEIEAWPTSYRWSFGDGTSLESHSLGETYPERSAIRHIYQRSSVGNPSGFPIVVEFSFEVRYRLAGGAWIDLPPISRTAGLDYPVRESQAVITR